MVKLSNIIKNAILCTLMLISFVAKPQNFSASYEYDANGNRTKATIIYLSQASSAPMINDPIEIDTNTSLMISIYPNPTQGNLTIRVSNASASQFSGSDNAIKVWNLSGTMIIDLPRVNEDNTVDLSSYPNGVYILNLYIGGKVKGYKIIKN